MNDLDDAITYSRYIGSDHAEVIASRDAVAAARFDHALRSAMGVVNASARFSGSGELDVCAEISISMAPREPMVR
jgi:glutamate-5-semialdehyde dehydrogenase